MSARRLPSDVVLPRSAQRVGNQSNTPIWARRAHQIVDRSRVRNVPVISGDKTIVKRVFALLIQQVSSPAGHPRMLG